MILLRTSKSIYRSIKGSTDLPVPFLRCTEALAAFGLGICCMLLRGHGAKMGSTRQPLQSLKQVGVLLALEDGVAKRRQESGSLAQAPLSQILGSSHCLCGPRMLAAKWSYFLRHP